MGDEHGGAALGRLARPRCHERPVGAAATRPRKRGTAEEEQADGRVRRVSGCHGLVVDEREKRGTDHALGFEVGLGLLEAHLVASAAERLVLDTAREDELVDRGDAPGRRARRVAGGVGGLEHHSDRHGLVLVRDDAEGGEPFDEIQRRAGLAELPFGARAAV